MKRHDKKLVGVGGIRCYCCTTGPTHDTKKMISRRARRREKQKDYSIVKDI